MKTAMRTRVVAATVVFSASVAVGLSSQGPAVPVGQAPAGLPGTAPGTSQAMTDQWNIPNPCTGCHTERTADWAREALKGWSGPSPWRMN
jgi:hypothetical protein